MDNILNFHTFQVILNKTTIELFNQQKNAVRGTTCNYHHSGYIHHPVFYLIHDVSETGFCLHFQMEPIRLDPTYTASLCLQTAATSIRFIKPT
jgi:hypothetical protein